MRCAVVTFAAFLAACSVEMQYRQPFADSPPITQQVEAAAHGPDVLEVRLLEDRAWVEPTNKWHRENVTQGATDRWVANVEAQRKVYEQAVLLSLKDRSSCRVTNGTPYPGFRAFEFAYVCGE